MLKKSGKVFYEYQDKQLDLKKIYAMNRKRPGLSKYLLSVEANLIQKEKGRSYPEFRLGSSLSVYDPY